MILMTNFGDKKQGDKNYDSDGDNTSLRNSTRLEDNCGMTQDRGLSLGDNCGVTQDRGLSFGVN